MNKALLFLLLLTTNVCFSQDNVDTTSIYYALHGEVNSEYIAALESPELNILYRGYPNMIVPAVENSNLPVKQQFACLIFGSGCSITRKQNAYIVKPGRADSVIIALALQDGDSTIPVLRKTYRAAVLPSPDLHWGNSRSGRKANKKSMQLTAKYSEEGIPLKADFSVMSWKINHNGQSFEGEGGDLSNASRFLKGLKSDSSVVIEAVVKGPDGIGRPLSGVWIIK